jgi:quercetin 2,3-dioxygenase
MIRTRLAADRGHADLGWLKTSYTFSFNTYHDPAQMGFRVLRVINEDVVLPGQGFGTHGHRDMEIITYVLQGELEHRDSLGNGGIIRAGELQRMTAGTGIRHSEFNPSSSVPLHLYQIWILPDRQGHAPSYVQRAIQPAGGASSQQLIASRDGRDGSLTIHQDAKILLGTLEPGQSQVYSLEPSRHAWIQVVYGSVQMNSQVLSTSDGAAVSGEPSVRLEAGESAQVMLFDLP